MATPKKPQTANPVGRPTDYKPEYCHRAREMLKEGFSIVEIAAEFDVNRKTLYDWADKFPEFSNTIYGDIDLSEAWWTKAGRENLKEKSFNSRLYEINMMNRFGWMKKNQDKVENTVKFEDSLKNLDD